MCLDLRAGHRSCSWHWGGLAMQKGLVGAVTIGSCFHSARTPVCRLCRLAHTCPRAMTLGACHLLIQGQIRLLTDIPGVRGACPAVGFASLSLSPVVCRPC